ncbi:MULTISPECIES: hypothetical protein [Oceanobacillus]|uniref:RNA polymerase subunit sigma-70 n=1 Tax=Oceanobacillus kimchii TaxID=746691 RepID=A0ABQ5TM67_9BACI|nr:MULTISPECIES: hypothetical protein [Oceanobacillus]MBT2598225.1 hypothetical protein [Oceanobacillus sp. ISL-74]MBT2651144.1 hypothetical protein [Oceanobacillus sp. ISL-73]MCT1575803.1 hypothetical protein [Oceanobacillus kimchii]MCT2135440.1 hypothetical protein [Oceanobacillus kimchii]GLO66679.1 hypothetical protein MACH08_24630 [Oceanobacillus kimchii]
MRVQKKHWGANQNSDLLSADLHHFMEIEESSNYMEIASELGISIGEVKLLKKKIIRS